MSGDPDAIEALADALGVARYQLAIAAGSLRRADELARGVAAGDVTIEEARADLDLPGVAPPGRPAGPPGNGSFRRPIEMGNSIRDGFLGAGVEGEVKGYAFGE